MNASTRKLVLLAPDGIPEVGPETDLANTLLAALKRQKVQPESGDIFVVAQKIISKWEGRLIKLSGVNPGARAQTLACETGKDPRIVELILREASEIVRKRPGLIIARHRNGCILANAGIDLSNVASEDGALLLPEDPDRSADRLSREIRERSGHQIAVVINDSMGRPWRLGTVGTAIGASGIEALQDRRGLPDRGGRTLQASIIGAADEIAASASLLMGQGAESLPFVLVRGADWLKGRGRASDLLRPSDQDLFR